jgi:hypothetical protein
VNETGKKRLANQNKKVCLKKEKLKRLFQEVSRSFANDAKLMSSSWAFRTLVLK